MEKAIETQNNGFVNFHDPEMVEAVEELKQANIMLDNVTNVYRQNEASYRVQAALERIQAIIYERSGTNDKELVSGVVKTEAKEQAI